ncbi:MAG: 1-deoxy-D-xylulose-5-phosphate synthase, partial [Gemmatimonadetes bacterium]|nr:1-deoxy-D-xylulose-5-phosphate synthase [Gemmatimonadota bacterium]
EVLRKGSEVAVLAVGTMVNAALAAAETLDAEGLPVTVVNCRYLKPYDELTLAAVVGDHRQLLVVEEGTVVNGFGAYVRKAIDDRWPEVHGASMGLPDVFVEHGERAELLAELGLTPEGIVARARVLLGRPLRSLAETA